MIKLALFSAVAPADDPVLAGWSAMTSAGDYFENPDEATLAHWRRARQAVRVHDWSTAVDQMQAIRRTTVRTRQPFRAAFGWARLSNRPDQPAAAYPFLQEAAAAGDRRARAWVAQEDERQGRYPQALRWAEAAMADGEKDWIPRLLELYAMDAATVPRDAAREADALQRIVTTADAPPLASFLLARLYEHGEGVEVSAAQAFVHYRRAAQQGLAGAWPEVARCHLRGAGTPIDNAQALHWAGRAFAAGEREKSVPILTELMRREPEHAAAAVAQLLEHEQTAAPAGFQDIRVAGPGIQQLQLMLAHYFDAQGLYAEAARAYARSGKQNRAAAGRLAELTAGHPCPTCNGTGKIQVSLPCPTCGGTGTVLCSHCDGRGYTYEPGTPPCPTCGGRGTMVQDGHVVTCAACGGTGKGKGSVIKKDCAYCVHGRVPCRDCTDGRIIQTKECPDCHGTGLRARADG
jgi:TPR repeat protein